MVLERSAGSDPHWVGRGPRLLDPDTQSLEVSSESSSGHRGTSNLWVPGLRVRSPAGDAVGVPEWVHEEVPRIDGDHLLGALNLSPVIFAQHNLVGQGVPAGGGGQVSPGPTGLLPLPRYSSPLPPACPTLMQAQEQVKTLTRCSGLQS